MFLEITFNSIKSIEMEPVFRLKYKFFVERVINIRN